MDLTDGAVRPSERLRPSTGSGRCEPVERRFARRRLLFALVGLGLVGGAMAPRATAHFADMWSHVDQTFQLHIRPDSIEVHVSLAYNEFPGLTLRREMDGDHDRKIAKEELERYCEKVGGEIASLLVLVVNGRPVPLRSKGRSAVSLFGEDRVVPVRADQHTVVSASVRVPAGRVSVKFATRAFPDNPGFFRYKLLADGVRVIESSAPDEEPNPDPLWFYDPLEIRQIEFTYEVAETPAAEALKAPPKEIPATAPTPRPVRDTVTVGIRAFRERVAAYFLGESGFWAFVVLLAVAFVYGGIHALAPGHAKTITAAYLIGSHARAWHAVLLGIVVTVSHTWSIYVLALVTHFFYRGEVPPQTHGVVMAVSGGFIVVLGLGQFVARLRRKPLLGHHHGHSGHTHGAHSHEHPHDAHSLHHFHDHGHPHEADHDHDHPHDAHPHSHAHVADDFTLKSLFLLGFSGGIVPCPGALWIYFLALSLHRTLEGIVLITALGAGLATVLIAVGLLTVRLRRSALLRVAGEDLRLARRLPGLHGRAGAALDGAIVWVGRHLALIAPCIIAAVGLLLVAWGLLSAGIIGS